VGDSEAHAQAARLTERVLEISRECEIILDLIYENIYDSASLGRLTPIEFETIDVALQAA
jgi:hypothetical protein